MLQMWRCRGGYCFGLRSLSFQGRCSYVNSTRQRSSCVVYLSSTCVVRRLYCTRTAMANSDIKSSSEFHALHGFLAGHASSESHAQEKFCEPVEDKYMQTQDNEAIEELLWTAWQAVIETAKATPHHSEKRQKLVDFVLDIQKRPALAKDGKVCKVWDATVWADLPVFGAQVRENWNSSKHSMSDDCTSLTVQLRTTRALQRRSSIG